MTRLLPVLLAVLSTLPALARSTGFGVDAFNRVVPVSSVSSAVFSPLSFELDCVIFAEASDPLSRTAFAASLRPSGDFAEEYVPLARAPFERPATNGFRLAWVHALSFDEPRRVDAAYRSTIQELYGAEVCPAKNAWGVEAWVHTRFEGAFDGWRLPPSAGKDAFALHDLVSVTAEVLPTNALKRVLPTHTVYRLPLAGGLRLYALAPKEGRSVATVRSKLTSATLDEILAMDSAVVDPPVPVRLALPAADLVATNELSGAFSYFKMPTVALKPFPHGAHPSSLRQTVRLRLRVPDPPADAERPNGPLLFFIHDPSAWAIPAAGIL